MTFWQHLLATFFGSIAGFVFGLILHYCTERSKTTSKNKQLLKGLKKEFELNFSQIDRWIDDTDSVLRRVSADDHMILQTYRLTDFQRMFLQMCFQQGILYDRLQPKNIAYLNGILLHFDRPITDGLNNYIAQWNLNQVSKATTTQILDFELRTLKEYRCQLKELLEEIS